MPNRRLLPVLANDGRRRILVAQDVGPSARVVATGLDLVRAVEGRDGAEEVELELQLGVEESERVLLRRNCE